MDYWILLNIVIGQFLFILHQFCTANQRLMMWFICWFTGGVVSSSARVWCSNLMYEIEPWLIFLFITSSWKVKYLQLFFLIRALERNEQIYVWVAYHGKPQDRKKYMTQIGFVFLNRYENYESYEKLWRRRKEIRISYVDDNESSSNEEDVTIL